jgi:predicted metalloprotease with PDZ domain
MTVRRLLLCSAALFGAACRTSSNVAPTPNVSPELRLASAAAYDIAYRIAMPDPSTHFFDVTVTIGNVTDDAVRLQMPVWSPGRYARFDFARTLQDLTITGPNNTPLQWTRENGSLWRVTLGGAHSMVVHYRIFANTLSGTFSVLDTAHANWNGASLFMYVMDHKPDPVTLHVDLPAGWHIVNGDARANDQTDYRFENYDRLIDTPTEVAPALMVDSFNVDGRLYRTMVHHNGPSTAAQRRRFVGDVEKIVRYENTVFGAPPLQMYTFVFNIGYAGGDGMEHLYSTQIINRNPWRDQD